MSIYTDYGTTSSGAGLMDAASGGGIIAALLSTFLVAFIILIAVSIVLIIAQFKIFKKLGKPGWIALIPIYNLWVLLEAVDMPGWLAIVPGVNGIAAMIMNYKLAIKFGKSSLFAVCTILFPVICLPILGFSKVDNLEDSVGVNDNIYNNYNTGFNQDNYVNNQPINNFQTNNNSFNTNNNPNDFGQNNSFVNNQTPINNSFQTNDIFNQPSVQATSSPMVNDSKICPMCQTANNMNAMFCEKCGNKL